MEKLNETKTKDILIDLIIITLGSILYAISVVVFTSPNNIAPGGITGISIVLNHLFSLPVGVLILTLNFPLFIISIKYFGIGFLFKTIYATVASSIFIDTLSPILPSFKGEGLLTALYGGVISGIGLSLVFLRGGTTGGTDIASRIIKRYFPSVSLGRIILIIDSIVIIFSAVAFRSLNSALYAVVVIFCSTTVIDRILYGNSGGKIVYIISQKSPLIEDFILNTLLRGVTVIKATGGYTNDNQRVLMCVVKRHEVSRLTKAILTYDSSAFVVVGNADEISGLGFNKDSLE